MSFEIQELRNQLELSKANHQIEYSNLLSRLDSQNRDIQDLKGDKDFLYQRNLKLVEQIDQLKKENKILLSQNDKKLVEQQLIDSKDEYESKLEELEEQNITLIRELNSLKNDVTVKTNRLKLLESQLDESNRELSQAREENERLKENQTPSIESPAHDESKLYENELSQLIQKVTKLEQENEHLLNLSKSSKLDHELLLYLKESNKQMEFKAHNYDRLVKDNSKLSKKLAQYQSKFQNFNSEEVESTQNLLKKINMLEDLNKAKELALNVLREDLFRVHSAQLETVDQLAKLQKQLQSLKLEISDKELDISRLSIQVGLKDKHLLFMKDQMENISLERDFYRKKMNGNENIEKPDSADKALLEKLNSLCQEFEIQVAHISSLTESRNSKRQKIEEEGAVLPDKNEQILQLSKEKQELSIKLSELETELRSRDEQIKKLAATNHVTETSVETANTSTTSVSKELFDHLFEENQQLESKVSEFQVSYLSIKELSERELKEYEDIVEKILGLKVTKIGDYIVRLQKNDSEYVVITIKEGKLALVESKADLKGFKMPLADLIE
ncbi:BA75_02598T0 [Komagataella pastoris]|uniref:BA75_02598T0 n=1 Tax=Komagataella pastoris TaxID=4922 RepID=A0A1B2JB40_PICPA|nr:BA75_02598T0 [Komagataella pastoris]